MSTGAAVTLSWWGVHTVMSGTAYDRPRALPINEDTPTTQRPSPESSSTRRPPSHQKKPPSSERRSGSTAMNEEGRAPTTTPAPRKPEKRAEPSTSAPVSAPAGNAKAYAVEGGRVVFDMTATSAELASATPEAGWEVRVWNWDYMIRVTFEKDGRSTSVYCTWYQTKPAVRVEED
ncbi:hypothetical protein ACWF94_23510 [Streptomyces sp. NPDC055078]